MFARSYQIKIGIQRVLLSDDGKLGFLRHLIRPGNGGVGRAGFFTLLRYVLLPGIRPTLALMLILTVIWSFQVFEFIFIVTRGGPAYGSEVLATLAYRHAFFEGDVGQAAAVACVMSLFGLCATAAYLRLQTSESSRST